MDRASEEESAAEGPVVPGPLLRAVGHMSPDTEGWLRFCQSLGLELTWWQVAMLEALEGHKRVPINRPAGELNRAYPYGVPRRAAGEPLVYDPEATLSTLKSLISSEPIRPLERDLLSSEGGNKQRALPLHVGPTKAQRPASGHYGPSPIAAALPEALRVIESCRMTALSIGIGESGHPEVTPRLENVVFRDERPGDLHDDDAAPTRTRTCPHCGNIVNADRLTCDICRRAFGGA